MRFSLTILAVLTLLIAGCASRGEIETMQNQLNYLERSSVQMQDRIVQIDSLYRDAVEKNVAYQADLKLALKELLDQNVIIDARLTDMEARINDILNKLDDPNARAYSRPAATAGDTIADSTGGQPGLARVVPEKLFENAFRDLSAGNYDLAIMQFSEFVDMFASSSLVDDAQYWLGECHYGKQQYDKAIPEFEKVEKNYPKSDKLPPALYKLARSHEELGHKQQAKKLFERIVNDFPNSFETTNAQEKLKGM